MAIVKRGIKIGKSLPVYKTKSGIIETYAIPGSLSSGYYGYARSTEELLDPEGPVTSIIKIQSLTPTSTRLAYKTKPGGFDIIFTVPTTASSGGPIKVILDVEYKVNTGEIYPESHESDVVEEIYYGNE